VGEQEDLDTGMPGRRQHDERVEVGDRVGDPVDQRA
jgi:hypothetical protein